MRQDDEEDKSKIPKVICDAMHEKVPNGENGAITTVVQMTCQGIKPNKNQLKILSSFRDIKFLHNAEDDQPKIPEAIIFFCTNIS